MPAVLPREETVGFCVNGRTGVPLRSRGLSGLMIIGPPKWVGWTRLRIGFPGLACQRVPYAGTVTNRLCATGRDVSVR